MTSVTLTIDKASPSLNELQGLHWVRLRARNLEWLNLVCAAKLNAGLHGMPMFERAKVHIMRQGAKLLDEDNLAGGMKPLIDSLRKLGIIVDDSPDRMSLTVEQRIGKPKRTTIHVEQVLHGGPYGSP